MSVFSGDSGAPVLNAKGLVVGILVRQFPDVDYVADNLAGCNRSNVCDSGGHNCLSGQVVDHPGAQIQRLDPLIFDLIERYRKPLRP